MRTSTRSTTYALMYFLVALSVLGGIVASQQYFFLQSEKVVMSARRTLDESFLIAMKAVGGESNPKMDKELAQQETIIEGTYSSAAAIIRQLEIRALADTIAWCVVLVISGWALIINARKKPKSGDPPAVSSASTSGK